MNYSKLCLETFLKNQKQLFDEAVAENVEEAEEFLEDCMAQVLDSVREVREFLEEEGMDVDGLTDEELLDQSEVFEIPDGTFLVVEG